MLNILLESIYKTLTQFSPRTLKALQRGSGGVRWDQWNKQAIQISSVDNYDVLVRFYWLQIFILTFFF